MVLNSKKEDEKSVDYGFELIEKDKFKDALQYFNQFLEAETFDPRAIVGRTSALINLNREEEALNFCNYLLGKDCENDKYWINLGYSFDYLLMKYNEAIKCYKNALRIKETPDIHYFIGLRLIEMDRNQDAIVCFDNALKVKNYEPDFLNGKGLALFTTSEV